MAFYKSRESNTTVLFINAPAQFKMRVIFKADFISKSLPSF